MDLSNKPDEEFDRDVSLLSIPTEEFTKLVSDFLAEVAPDFKCPVCSNNSATVTREISKDQLIGIPAAQRSSNGPFFVSQITYNYLITCDRCGFQMLHSYSQLDDWWRRRRGSR